MTVFFKLLISFVAATVLLLTASVATTGQKITILTKHAEALIVPEVTIPPEALATGLGGRVNALVRVDNTGKVIGILGVSGPDSICYTVTRNDVLAIRAEAERVARETIFTPAMTDGVAIEITTTLPIMFDTPDPKKGLLYTPVDESPASESDGDGSDNVTLKPSTPSSKDSDGPIEAVSVDKNGIAKGGDLTDKAIRLAKPIYPDAARRLGVSGAVEVQVLILEDGTVFSAQQVSGPVHFTAASAVAACGSAFRPTTHRGVPVKVSGFIVYDFVL